MARFNPVEFYRKAASTKPLSIAAPPRRRTSATAPQLSTAGHLFDKGGILLPVFAVSDCFVGKLTVAC